MTASATHNHQRCIREALRKAEEVCSEKGGRFTSLRQRILELVWQKHEPVKAYELLAELADEEFSAKPPTVYRALEFLMEYGLVHKLESLNAYVGCVHPQAGHNCYFFMCTKCGGINEFCDEALSKNLTLQAKKHGFLMEKQTIEVQGVCEGCQKSEVRSRKSE